MDLRSYTVLPNEALPDGPMECTAYTRNCASISQIFVQDKYARCVSKCLPSRAEPIHWHERIDITTDTRAQYRLG